jgi:uncharacterized protein DUF6510
MNSQSYSHLDGNAAAGELNTIFAIDITGAEAQCAIHIGAGLCACLISEPERDVSVQGFRIPLAPRGCCTGWRHW